MAAPRLIVVMGVSGSGKTTLARVLAERLGWRMVDADDFHSAEAVARMHRGEPLTDAMREPWMRRLLDQLAVYAAAGHDCVLAWSGLRRAHRDRVRALPMEVRLVLLHADAAVLLERLAARGDHFMPPSLLQSQLDAFEPVGADEHVHVLDATSPPDVLGDAVIRSIDAHA
ncbi:MAG: gluconokinase, GntK/IdnK-type [Vicinamibacterales bacterium]